MAVSSVTAYLQMDPLDMIAILLDRAGMDDKARKVDELNRSL